MQRTTQKKRVKNRRSPLREDNSQNPFEAALAAVCDKLEQSGRFTATLSDMLYLLFRIRAQKTGWRGDGCRHVMLEEVVQECMLNFWKGMCRPGKMRSHLLTLTSTNLRAYVAGTVRLLILRQKWDLQKTEERQRGYCSPPEIMTRELDEETGRNWWDNRACYVIYRPEQNSVEFRRVSYHIARTKKKILRAKLPRFTAQRLSLGR